VLNHFDSLPSGSYAIGYLRLATQTGIRLAVQLPQNAFIERVDSSKIVVECDMQTCWPQSEQEVTARPLQTEHLAIYFTPNSLLSNGTRSYFVEPKVLGEASRAKLEQIL